MTIYDIKFDEQDHDMSLDGADIAFSDEDDAVRNRLAIRLQFLLNEWFLDNRVGLPYTQRIFEQGTSIEDVYQLFRNEINNTPGVDSIQTLELIPTPDSKLLTVNFTVNNGVSSTVEVVI